MSKKAEEAAETFHNQALSDANEYARMHGGSIIEEVCYGRGLKAGFIKGYEQAEKDTIERACQLLYDYNKQMAEIFGAKAVLSCNQFTIDVERFRKTLIMEEE